MASPKGGIGVPMGVPVGDTRFPASSMASPMGGIGAGLGADNDSPKVGIGVPSGAESIVTVTRNTGRVAYGEREGQSYLANGLFGFELPLNHFLTLPGLTFPGEAVTQLSVHLFCPHFVPVVPITGRNTTYWQRCAG